MSNIASQITKLWLIELRVVRVVEGGEEEEGEEEHINSMGPGRFTLIT